MILLPSGLQLNCLHQVGVILVPKLYIFQPIGYLCPIIHKICIARGAKLPTKLGVPGVLHIYTETSLETGLFWEKCRVPFVYTLWCIYTQS